MVVHDSDAAVKGAVIPSGYSVSSGVKEPAVEPGEWWLHNFLCEKPLNFTF